MYTLKVNGLDMSGKRYYFLTKKKKKNDPAWNDRHEKFIRSLENTEVNLWLKFWIVIMFRLV